MVEGATEVERHELVRGLVGEMQIERTQDYDAIRLLACHPAIFPHVSDDWTSNPYSWRPPESKEVFYLIASDQGSNGQVFRGIVDRALGFAVFVPETRSCFQAHMAFLPRSYGDVALSAFKEMLHWMWNHSTAARIVGQIPIENRRAIAFAKRAGFVEYGVNPKSYLLGGVLRDQVCLGISRP